MPKEDRSDWVAVAPEFKGNSSLSNKIRPAASAYQFFQKAQTPRIKSALLADGTPFLVSKLSKAVSDEWASLLPEEKVEYEELAREDAARFARESHEADIAAIERRERLRREREELVLLDDDFEDDDDDDDDDENDAIGRRRSRGGGGTRKTRGQYRKETKKKQRREKRLRRKLERQEQRRQQQQQLSQREFGSDVSDDDDLNDNDDDDSSASFDEEEHDDDDGSSSSNYDSDSDSMSKDSDDDDSDDDDDDDDDGDDDNSEGGSDASYRERPKKKRKTGGKRKKKKLSKKKKKKNKRSLSPKVTNKAKAKPKVNRPVSQKQMEYREKIRQEKLEKEQYIEERQEDLRKERSSQAKKRLMFLLKQSSIFSHFGAVQEDQAKLGTARKTRSSTTTNSTTSATTDTTTTTTTTTVDHDPNEPLQNPNQHFRREDGGDQVDAQDLAVEEDLGQKTTFLTSQPSTLGHGKMRDYQLEGLNWMIGLQENGVNGILADEMGLGKTLQSISILVFMQEYRQCDGPHLIVVPKSTLSNWVGELHRWAPTLKAIKFHGDKSDRETIVKSALEPGQRDEYRTWNVCVTTYEVCNIEKNTLNKFAWSYLIIDEAHRLKNEASAFSKTIRSFETRYRVLLTGTPLQNSLHELWALLNFLVPDVFASAEQFDEWFNLDIEDNDEKNKLISQLHKILRPFMLRRLKADVETTLPPKHETILFTGMSAMQKKLYRDILIRDIDAIQGDSGGSGGGGGGNRTAILNIVMQLRKCAGHPYLFPGVEDRSLPPLGEHLVENCGKMVLLDKLLKRLKERGHRVLLFTQMTRILDIMEDYLVMRRFRYCRIDGNTTYEVREDFIESFNAPNSDIFLFLLSTRAGGLGINLQTADVVILYDSDWNPQADLQAQDRAHRIGQKKPVQIFRFVTEHTIEEKIVERAQQKLKLDAMVVQQGRLKDRDNKLSREELLDAVKFGADKIFKSKDSSITDDDIDMILSAGKKKTEELNEKLKSADKGDLLDFKLDANGPSLQTFEGVDYSSNALAQAKADAQLLSIIDMGKRERKTVANYNENLLYQQQIAALQGKSIPPKKKKKELRLPKYLRLPRMEEWQMYDQETLRQIQEEEEAAFRALTEDQQRLLSNQTTIATTIATTTTTTTTTTTPTTPKEENNDAPVTSTDQTFPSKSPDQLSNGNNDEDNNSSNNKNPETSPAAAGVENHHQQQQDQQEEIPPLLSDEKRALKDKLLAEGFADWRRPHYNAFIRASARYGRSNIAKIAIDVAKSELDVQSYCNAFWNESIGKVRFSNSEYERVVKQIERGEKKIDEMKGLQRGTKMLVSLFENPWEELEFTHVNCRDKLFTLEEDRHLLCWTHKYGYGQWHAIKMAIRRSPSFRFDYFLRSIPVDALGRRCEQLMKAAEKEVEHMERKAREEAGGLSPVVSSDNGKTLSNDGEEFRLMQKQIRLAKKSKAETQRRQLESRVSELENDIKKIQDRLKHLNEFGGGGGGHHNNMHVDDNNIPTENQASSVVAEDKVGENNHDHGRHAAPEGGESEPTGSPPEEIQDGAVGPDGDYVPFPQYDPKSGPPKERKKAFSNFCNATRREVKESVDPADRKNKNKINGILRDRWLDLPEDDKDYWRKWATWDKKRHRRDTALFQKMQNQENPAATNDAAEGATENGDHENDMVIPKKRRGSSNEGGDRNNNNNTSGGFGNTTSSSIPKKRNRHN